MLLKTTHEEFHYYVTTMLRCTWCNWGSGNVYNYIHSVIYYNCLYIYIILCLVDVPLERETYYFVNAYDFTKNERKSHFYKKKRPPYT